MSSHHLPGQPGMVPPPDRYGSEPPAFDSPPQDHQPVVDADLREPAVPPGSADSPDASYERYRAEDRSLGEIASDVLDNASTLIRQEIELAKAEVQQSAKRAGAGAGMFAGAAVAALLMLIALTLTLWWAFAVLIGSPSAPALGISGVIVMLLWGVIAGVLALVGKNQFDKIKGLPQTQETVQKIPHAVTGHEEKNR